MKRRFTILTAALALLVSLAIPMGIWGQTTTDVTLSSGTFNNNVITWTCADGNITIQQLKGSSSNNPNGSYISAPRVYKQNILSFVGNNGYTITNIDIKCDGSYYGTTKYAGTEISNNNVENNTTALNPTWSTANGGTHTIATVSSDGLNEIYIQNGHSSDANNQLRITKLTITYKVSGSVTATTVTINTSGLTNTDVYTSTTAGSLSATVKENTNNTVISGATVSWSSSDTNVATIDNNGTVTLVAVGTTTITASYAGGNGYGSSSATYELTVTSSEPYVQPTTIEITPNYEFWGKTGQFSGDTYSELEGSKDNVTLNWTKGSGSTYANSTAMRFYKDNNLTFTAPEGYEIISIALTVSGSYSDLTFSPTGYDNTTTTWTGSSSTVTMSRPSNASSYATISNFTITLAPIGSAVTTTTTINVSSDFNTDIYQGTTAGTLTATVSAEGTPINGATVTWSSSNTGVATIDANGAVTLVAVGTTNITASYAGVEDQYRPSEGSYELTVTDSNAPGTQNNPYTVAQARAAIDAGTGTQGVYATGIVSSIETAWSTQYSNITFNFVDNAGDTDFLQAYRCVSGTGVDASTVAVGDIVVVHGNLTKYGSTYEFGQGCELVSLEHPTTPFVTVTPSTINAPFAGAEGTLALTYENIEEFISFDYYFCDADGNELEDTDPDYPGDWIYAEINDENEAYTLSYIIDANDSAARTAYMKVYTLDDNLEEVYAIVTVNQAKYVVDYATLPFAFNGGKDAIEETNGLTQSGLASDYADENTKLKFDSTDDYVILKINERPGTLTFNIKGNSFSGGTFKVQTSADGVSYSDLETYTTFGNNETYEEEFDNLNENVRYIKWVYTNKSSGNVGLGHIALAEYVAPALVASITVNPDVVELDAEEHDGTLDLAYENLTITDMTDFDIQFCDANGDELSEEPDWIEVLVAEQDPTIGEGYVVSYYMVENEGPDARTAYFKVYAMDDETNLVYSNLVTISQAAPVAPATGDAYALYTGELIEGDYLIVYDGGAMNTTVTNDRLQFEEVSATNNVIVTDNAAIVWHIAPSGQYWTIYNANADAYAASTGAKNKAQMLSDGTDDKALWTVSGNETYEFVNKKNAANNVNANLRKNGEYGFACYATSTGGALSLYKKVALTIKGYGEDSNRGGYYLIASPLGTINPENVPGMLSDSYDLYRFDQVGDAQGNEWINYKGDATNPGMGNFDLEIGKGYLYAHSSDITLNFTGTPIEGTDYEVELRRNESASFKGWNLVGNPFTKTAYIDNTHNAYYTMDAAGALFVPVTGNSVDPMEGIFVVAKSDEEIITFSTTAPNNEKCSTLALNLSQGQSLLDRAIVRFDEGSQLPKLQFNRNSSKVCIPMDDEDYAVVRAEEMGEMPVNFKAESNGTYSLNFGMDNVEFAYLHLIDNLTGNEVDLLQTPSYSFEAKTTDYENRFKLVFATGDNSNEDNFAYFSNGSFVINNEGNATLQVIDITGRIMKSESINGCANVNVNGATGVYMLRLVNGDNVMVQKVVVK